MRQKLRDDFQLSCRPSVELTFQEQPFRPDYQPDVVSIRVVESIILKTKEHWSYIVRKEWYADELAYPFDAQTAGNILNRQDPQRAAISVLHQNDMNRLKAYHLRNAIYNKHRPDMAQIELVFNDCCPGVSSKTMADTLVQKACAFEQFASEHGFSFL